MSKQLHGTGRFWPKILLYGENNPDKLAIKAVFKYDLQKGPDTIIIIRTCLKVSGVRILAKEFCHIAKARRRSGVTL